MMDVDPELTPVTVGVMATVVIPCGTRIVDGDTVAIDGDLLARLIETPPDGAAAASDTGSVTVCPWFTETLVGSTMVPFTA